MMPPSFSRINMQMTVDIDTLYSIQMQLPFITIILTPSESMRSGWG